LTKCFKRVSPFTWTAKLCATSSSNMCSRMTLRLLVREVAATKNLYRVRVSYSLSFRNRRVRGGLRVKIAGIQTVRDRLRWRVMGNTIKASQLKRRKANLRRRKNVLPHLTMLLIRQWTQASIPCSQ